MSADVVDFNRRLSIQHDIEKGERLMAKTLTEAQTLVIPEITKNLQEFGYELLEEHVKEALEDIVNGRKLGIIGMFTRDMLIKNRIGIEGVESNDQEGREGRAGNSG